MHSACLRQAARIARTLNMPFDEPPRERKPAKRRPGPAATDDLTVVDNLAANPPVAALELSINDTYLTDVIDDLLDPLERGVCRPCAVQRRRFTHPNPEG
jgi:hypothetical protein